MPKMVPEVAEMVDVPAVMQLTDWVVPRVPMVATPVFVEPQVAELVRF